MLLTSVALLFSGTLQAMEIQKFDKMADADQDEYVAELVQGAEKVLIDAGKPDLAAEIHRLFTTRLGNDKTTIGSTEFGLNLARARVTDSKNILRDPSTRRIQVEDAMAVTLKKNGIELPPSFFTVMSGFKPSHTADRKN
jgi:hypothetical protein